MLKMVSYTPEDLDELLALASKLGSQEDSNVRIHGEHVVVVSPLKTGTRIAYIGRQSADETGLIPGRSWVADSLIENGITKRVIWLETVNLHRDFSARQWLVQKLGLQQMDCMAEFNRLIYNSWTVELMIEYAIEDLL